VLRPRNPSLRSCFTRNAWYLWRSRTSAPRRPITARERGDFLNVIVAEQQKLATELANGGPFVYSHASFVGDLSRRAREAPFLSLKPDGENRPGRGGR
jgi:hypothetical protein